MQNSHSIFQDTIEDLVGIANKREDPQSGPCRNARRCLRPFGDETYDITNAPFKRQSNDVTKRGLTIG